MERLCAGLGGAAPQFDRADGLRFLELREG